MAKVTRPNLSRGVKLTTRHIHKPLADMAAELSNSAIESEQMERPWGSFRVNLHFPFIDDTFFSLANQSAYFIPFILPPLQDYYATQTVLGSTRPLPGANTPRLILDEVMLSFDQRGEPAAIAGTYYGDSAGTHAGKLDYRSDALDAYNLKVSILSKTPEVFGGGTEPERELVSIDVPSDVFSGAKRRENPLIVDGLNKAIDPYQTLILAIDGSSLNPTGTQRYALVSLMVSLRFRHPLVPRDTGDDIQNIPTKHDGGKTGPTVTVVTPAPNTIIRADGAEGVQTNIDNVDVEFRKGLDGGYDEHAEAGPIEALDDESCYDVIAVPLFGGGAYGGMSSDMIPILDSEGGLWYAIAPGLDTPIGDRRIIPLDFPFVLHHAVLLYNWQAFAASRFSGQWAASQAADSATFKAEVGVNLLHGIRADAYTYANVAQLTLTGPGLVAWGDKRIDTIANGIQTKDTYSLELHSIPLVGSGGAGFYAQGKPVFCGPGWTGTFGRRPLNGVTPATIGAEQAIEVRMHISDENGLGSTGLGGAQSPGSIIVGYGGHWVFLIGKKSLA